MVNKFKLGRYVIGFQGFYYLITGLWALLFLSNFERVVGHMHEGLPFEMHSIAAMSVVLGVYFIYSVRSRNWFKNNISIAYLVMGIALSVILVELFYLPKMGWNLFWVDLIEEILITLLLLWVIKK